MVFPWVRVDAIMKFRLVNILIAQIDNQITVWMPLIKEFRHLVDAIPIDLLSAFGSWEAHPQYTLRDVSNIEVILVIYEPASMTAYFLLDGNH